MNPHKLTLQLFLLLACFVLPKSEGLCQQRKAPPGGRVAVVIDERLSALRSTPQLTGKLLRRVGRGRLVAIRAAKKSDDGIVFFLVNLSTRTHGWIQREAVASPSHPDDDQKLWRLIKNSTEFERLARARIFLDHFRRSPLSSEVLLLFGDTAEEAAVKLSRDAGGRIAGADAAPEFSYYLNYAGLDRYNRQGVHFGFDRTTKRFHYDGTAWREIVRRFPKTAEAFEARRRLAQMSASTPYFGAPIARGGVRLNLKSSQRKEPALLAHSKKIVSVCTAVDNGASSDPAIHTLQSCFFCLR